MNAPNPIGWDFPQLKDEELSLPLPLSGTSSIHNSATPSYACRVPRDAARPAKVESSSVWLCAYRLMCSALAHRATRGACILRQ